MLTFLLSGCLYSNVRAPGPNNRITTYELDTDDFTIIGLVESEGEIITILGLVSYGGDGWNALMDKARAAGGEDIMNYHLELQGFAILTFVYNRATWKATATAIRYKPKARSGPPLKHKNTAENSTE